MLLTLWSGLVMFMLDESSDSADKTVHEILSGVTVFANAVYVLYLFFILVRQILHEKRKEGSAVVAKLDQVLARIRSSSSSVNTASDVDPTLGIELPPMDGGEDGEDGEDVDDESNEVEEADELSSGRVNPMFEKSRRKKKSRKKSRRKRNPSAEPVLVAALSAAEMKIAEQAEEEEEEEANQQHQIDIQADLTTVKISVKNCDNIESGTGATREN